MSEFRFLHAADIHLDSPMRGLEAEIDAPVQRLRGATRAAFKNLIDLAIVENVAFVAIAGDLYDGDWHDWRTGIFLTEQVARLSAVGIPLVMIAGNHDAASVITRHLRLPPGVTMLPHDECGRIIFEQHGVAIHGRSFPTKAVTEDLTAGYPAPLSGLFNIGLLHTAMNGRPGHDRYAPTTVETLVAKGYNYWALGHIHDREEIHREPWIVFPGNLQGRHMQETGAKGATLVTVRNGRVETVEHRPLDVARWCKIHVGLPSTASFDDAMTLIGARLGTELHAAEGRPIAARVVLTGKTGLHGSLVTDPERLRQSVISEGRQHGADEVWIESVVLNTLSNTDLDDLRERPDAVGRLFQILDDLVKEPDLQLLGDYPDRLREKLRDVDLPAEHPLRSEAGRKQLFREARDLILAHLNEGA